MNDRELLERAAKAAGLQIEAVCEVLCCWMDVPDGIGGFWEPWNALEDDGDALRLAVKLRLDLIFCEFQVKAVSQIGPQDFFESYQLDRGASARRAIVRAAASMCTP